jgi:predicted esterase
MRRLLPLLAIVLLAGCGGGASTSTNSAPTTMQAATTAEQASTASSDATADVFPATGPSRATVVLYHGWTDLEPSDYLPWIDHLNAEGATVLFPRYQQSVVSLPAQMLADAETATKDGFAKSPTTKPVISVGYSLGGGYAVVYGANAKAWQVPAPAAVLSIFPAMPPTVPEPFGTVPKATPVTLLVGDQDTVVGSQGAKALAAAIAPHPATIDTLSSTAQITFDHLAPKRADPAAQKAFWAPLDRIVQELAPR